MSLSSTGPARSSGSGGLPQIDLPAGVAWNALLRGPERPRLEAVLPDFLASRRWFGGKARRVARASVVDDVPIHHDDEVTHVALVRVDYAEGEAETYLLPLALATGERAAALLGEPASPTIARLRLGDADAVVYDATCGESFARALLDSLLRRRRFRGSSGEIVAESVGRAAEPGGAHGDPLASPAAAMDHSNTSIVYGNRLIVKLYRRVVEGPNPEVEICRFLGERTRFAGVPRFAGSMEYRTDRGMPSAVALLQSYVPNLGDAREHALRELRRYLDRALALGSPREDIVPPTLPLIELARVRSPACLDELTGGYLEAARRLGRQTGELHLALGSDTSAEAFRPEPLTMADQSALYESVRQQTSRSFALLRGRLAGLPCAVMDDARSLLDRESGAIRRLGTILDGPIGGSRMRTHGDLHLEQALYTGDGFAFIDFEGEPARPLEQRRAKLSPLRDVAGMLRSYHYAAHTAVMEHPARGSTGEADRALARWATVWQAWVSAAYLGAYLEAASKSDLLPRTAAGQGALLDLFIWEKAVYELAYELNNRPDWVGIPVAGLLRISD